MIQNVFDVVSEDGYLAEIDFTLKKIIFKKVLVLLIGRFSTKTT